jgi:hypothetical protein
MYTQLWRIGQAPQKKQNQKLENLGAKSKSIFMIAGSGPLYKITQKQSRQTKIYRKL